MTKGTERRWHGAHAGAMSQGQPQVSTGSMGCSVMHPKEQCGCMVCSGGEGHPESQGCTLG